MTEKLLNTSVCHDKKKKKKRACRKCLLDIRKKMQQEDSEKISYRNKNID